MLRTGGHFKKVVVKVVMVVFIYIYIYAWYYPCYPSMHGAIHGFNRLFFSLTDKVLSGALLFIISTRISKRNWVDDLTLCQGSYQQTIVFHRC